MAEFRSAFTVEAMSRILNVSKSGFYDWIKHTESQRDACDHELETEIRKIFRASGETYGCPRMLRALRKRGIRIGKNRVRRIMKKAELQAKTWKKKRVRTTDSKHSLPISPNLLQRNFKTEAPNRVWVSDITYIRTNTGWVYLCVVVDLFSRKIVGWSLQPHMKASLVCEAFLQACRVRNVQPGKLIFHSDRGSQYASKEFRQLLAEYKVIQSMSGKGECLDNAVGESIFSTIKRELTEDSAYRNFAEARRDILFYIEGFYNSQRLHSYLDYMSPDEFEEMMEAA